MVERASEVDAMRGLWSGESRGAVLLQLPDLFADQAP